MLIEMMESLMVELKVVTTVEDMVAKRVEDMEVELVYLEVDVKVDTMANCRVEMMVIWKGY